MIEFCLSLNKVEDVKRFVKIAEDSEAQVIVSSEDKRFSVDGTSLLGLFSLDLSNDVRVVVSDSDIGYQIIDKCRIEIGEDKVHIKQVNVVRHSEEV